MCQDRAPRSAIWRHHHWGLCLIIIIWSFYPFHLLINPWKGYLLGYRERIKLSHLGVLRISPIALAEHWQSQGRAEESSISPGQQFLMIEPATLPGKNIRAPLLQGHSNGWKTCESSWETAAAWKLRQEVIMHPECAAPARAGISSDMGKVSSGVSFLLGKGFCVSTS